MEKALYVEIFTEHLLVMNECMNCQVVWGDIESNLPIHQQQALAHLHGDEALEYLNIASWVIELLHNYGDQVAVRIVDANSLEGVLKSAQYGVHAYPAVVINRQDVYNALDLESATDRIKDILSNKQVGLPHETSRDFRHETNKESRS